MPPLEVLIPTRNRPAELATTLAGLTAQTETDFGVIVSDQSDGEASWEHPAAQAMLRVLEAQGRRVAVRRHEPRRGLAEHRQFLLEQSAAPRVLFLDDDVWLAPNAVRTLREALDVTDAGFVGMAVQGLSYLDNRRERELEPFEPWDGPVEPERLGRHEPGFARWTLHNAANPAHLAARALADGRLRPGGWLAYRIAWVGGCALFRRDVLVECGGFEFWRDLPSSHAGEDVVAQWRVMERYGGAGILPSHAVHLESPTTVPDREAEATEVLGRVLR
ncbi:glycosyltransferase family 2 protein [Sinomonas terrae]|uniref:Glycosyltransferase n=1 Tax=Sinomonas terrae TaxID=2908838 RepID=A0ABS9U4T7_9MICC|nr:glycosyltransferase family 2 protein [Sinomonas terrae]MCH6471694.1 glycosyltransferase [Sinomonas terrae]